MISIIHPSRGRPAKSFETIKKWVNMASGRINLEFIISLDDDDPLLDEYPTLDDYFKLDDDYHFYVSINPNKSAIEAINVAARIAKGDVFIVVSDDTDCPQGWDDIITEDIGSNWPKGVVVKYADGIQKNIVTMPVMDRAFYNRFGYIYNPIYKHGWCDTELYEVAKRTKSLVRRPDILFKHNHYSVTGEARDALYERNDALHDEGRRIFKERKKRNFDL